MKPSRHIRCRIYTEQPLHSAQELTLDATQAHYLRSVMRLAAGARIIMFNGQSGEYDAEINRLDKSGACCDVGAFHDVEREMACRVHIVQAACRSEKIEAVLQKGTELGAAGFHITRSERSSLKLAGSKLDARLERWRRIVVEAAEQSGRTRLPELSWHNALSDAPKTGLSLSLHPEASMPWREMREPLRKAAAVTLAIGPEGGFSERDLQALTDTGFQPLRFGPRIMRTETAAPALLAAIAAIA